MSSRMPITSSADCVVHPRSYRDILGKGGTDRILILHHSLPVEYGLKLLQDQGVLKIEDAIVRILRPENLGISTFQTSVLQSFSPSKKIEKEIQQMTSLYIELFDIENRLRFFIEAVQKKNTDCCGLMTLMLFLLL